MRRREIGGEKAGGVQKQSEPSQNCTPISLFLRNTAFRSAENVSGSEGVKRREKGIRVRARDPSSNAGSM